jgi:hypothetical protein
MRARGQRLRSATSPVVTYAGGISARRFFFRRLAHGKYFASRRGKNMSVSQRGLRSAAFPAVAALLLFRIGSRIFGKKRHRLKFALVTPWVCAFLISWAWGEALGYLNPAAANRPPLD